MVSFSYFQGSPSCSEMRKWCRRTRELTGVSFIASQKSDPHEDIKCSPCVSRLNQKRTHRKRGDKSGHRRPLEKEISPRTELFEQAIDLSSVLISRSHCQPSRTISNLLSQSTFSTASASATTFASSITMTAALIREFSEKINDLVQEASPVELLKTRLCHRGTGSDR